jgi:cell division protease FtsH
MITYALGGRAAEKLVFNHYTTGAGNDIEKASNIARKMVCEWGMSDKLGPLAYGAKEEEIFLGREIQKHRDYSEKTAIEIDEEIRSIVTTGFDRAVQILKDNMDLLHRLSAELLEREILDGEEIDRIIRGENLPPMQKEIKPTEDAVPDHVKKLMEQRQQQDPAPNNDSH